jgi:hypothetical protein
MPTNRARLIAKLLTAALLSWACGPAAAAIHIDGQVQGSGEPIANSTVTVSFLVPARRALLKPLLRRRLMGGSGLLFPLYQGIIAF